MSNLSDRDLPRLTAHLEKTGGDPAGFVATPKKRRKNEEWELQRDVFAWWRAHAKDFGLDSRLMFSIPNGSVLGGTTATRAIRGRMLKSAGMVNGAPDVMLAVRRVQTRWVPEDARLKMISHREAAADHAALFLELKAGAKGVISPEQIEHHALLRAQGYDVRVVRTFEEAVQVITSYLNSQ